MLQLGIIGYHKEEIQQFELLKSHFQISGIFDLN